MHGIFTHENVWAKFSISWMEISFSCHNSFMHETLCTGFIFVSVAKSSRKSNDTFCCNPSIFCTQLINNVYKGIVAEKVTPYHVILHYLSVYGSRDNTSCLGAHAHPKPERVVPEKGAYDMYKEECCSQNIALPVMCITTAHPVNELSEKSTENNLFKSRAYQMV